MLVLDDPIEGALREKSVVDGDDEATSVEEAVRRTMALRVVGVEMRSRSKEGYMTRFCVSSRSLPEDTEQ